MEDFGKIEGEIEPCSQEETLQDHSLNQEDSFVWDDNSQLYYHARSFLSHLLPTFSILYFFVVNIICKLKIDSLIM